MSSIPLLLLALTITAALAAPALAQSDTSKTYARFQIDNRTVYGIVEGDQIRELDGNLFASPQPTNRTHALAEVTLLAPSIPTKVFGAAANFNDPNNPLPPDAKPEFFSKTPSAVIAQGQPIIQPANTPQIVHEAELVVIIGKQCRNVTAEQAPDYIFGVTVGNDIACPAWNESDVQYWRGKGADTFAPLGPFIVTGIDYHNLTMKCFVNGELRTEVTGSQFLFNADQLVAFISQHMTLEPGDIIYTGAAAATPAGPGDTVTVTVEGVGTLTNPVIAAP